jgi:hypothetical protein
VDRDLFFRCCKVVVANGAPTPSACIELDLTAIRGDGSADRYLQTLKSLGKSWLGWHVVPRPHSAFDAQTGRSPLALQVLAQAMDVYPVPA